ncbi:MAG: radical SAM family heme chaperone HemW [Candidatus Marinimicrobia bacterium]|nr:radical SAM family heme chaperone HemW [Candidatus Neomarinimicrobiota bacterium]
MSDNFSIYIHFPFCERKCNYCSFYSLDNKPDLIPQWTEALCQELEFYEEQFQNKNLQTLYIGGGSPNLLPAESFEQLFSALKDFTDLNHLKEFTVEINPNNIKGRLLRTMRNNGVDRISIGAQSFFQDELNVLGRLHAPKQIKQAVVRVKNFNFPRISLDFIFGIPGQNLNTWRTTLEQAVNTGVEHLSLYNLSYEPGTPLTQKVKSGHKDALDEDLEWQMYKQAHEYLAQQGFEHYEISSWAKPGARSIHNQTYWNGTDYLGLGPAAHSYYSRTRRWNSADLQNYIDNLSQNRRPTFEKENIDDYKYRLEKLFLSLRTNQGINLSELSDLYLIPEKSIKTIVDKELGYRKNNLVVFSKNNLKLSLRGWFLSNSIIASLASKFDSYQKGDQP